MDCGVFLGGWRGRLRRARNKRAVPRRSGDFECGVGSGASGHRRLQRRRWQQTANADQLKLALGFQRDHKRHRDALTKFVRRFGGTPVEPKSSYDFGTIASATDIVKLAQSLEEGAEMAYLTNADKLVNHEILDAAVPILEDEVRHNIVLRQLLGMDVTERMKY